jgi:hypothetical protein
MIQHMFKKRAESPIYVQLCKVHMIRFSGYLDAEDVVGVVDALLVQYFHTFNRI